MPWRQTKQPYNIWLSEIMLQQTRVEQGLPYYLKFIDTFPTVFDLAKASEEEVLKLWQGLGYYSRARNLHAAATYVAEECEGVFPDSYVGLLKLKGVGDYTASAISSICYDEPVAVVDGNVYRVLARYYGIKTPTNIGKGIKEFKELATVVMNKKVPGDYNQAIMEFGALQCKPGVPDCSLCPLNESCVGLATHQIGDLPVKLKKTKITKRYFNYLVFIINDAKTIIQQRTGKGIWQNMYEFPLVASLTAMNEEEVMKSESVSRLLGANSYVVQKWNEDIKIHKLSHQHLYTSFYIIEIDEAPDIGDGQRIVGLETVDDYPVPVLIGDFIEKFALE